MVDVLHEQLMSYNLQLMNTPLWFIRGAASLEKSTAKRRGPCHVLSSISCVMLVHFRKLHSLF